MSRKVEAMLFVNNYSENFNGHSAKVFFGQFEFFKVEDSTLVE